MRRALHLLVPAVVLLAIFAASSPVINAQGTARAASTATSPPDADSIFVRGPARLLGPGVVSAALSEFGTAFTSSGSTVFFTVTDGGFSRMTIVSARLEQRGWQEPAVAPFSGFWNDGDVSASPDGDRLFFMSNRPVSGSAARGDFDIWFVDRRSDGSWGAPVHAGPGVNTEAQETYPSGSDEGGLYFARNGSILRAQWDGDAYGAAAPQALMGGERMGAPAVAPDESFLVFQEEGDLFVARRAGEAWLAPRPFAGPVNSSATETAPAVVAGRDTLCFSSDRRDWPVWPRPASVGSYQDIRAELDGIVLNGLRNIYCVDLAAADF